MWWASGLEYGKERYYVLVQATKEGSRKKSAILR